MLVFIVGKCPLRNETAEANTTCGNEICLPTKSMHLFCNPRSMFVSIITRMNLVDQASVPFLAFNFVVICGHTKLIFFLYQLLSDGESVRWLNHAVKKMWPICMEKIVSQLLRPIIPWFLDKFKPWTVVRFISSCYFIYFLSTNVLHS